MPTTVGETVVNGHTALSEAEHPTSFEQLIIVGLAVLRQGLELVSKTLTDDSQLSFPSRLIPGSTIGKHLRHALDHYSLLLESLNSKPVVLNYDKRQRDRPMETSRAAAVEAFEETIRAMEHLNDNPVDIDTELILNAVTPFPQTLKSAVGRELWFVSLHAIHHWSMARVVAGELDITLEDDFGVAPSTIAYRNLSDVEKGNPPKANL